MKRKIIIVSCVLVVVILLLLFFVYPQYKLSKKYADAINLYISGNYIEAINGFKDLETYKDSVEWIKKSEVSLAEQYVNENKFNEAIKIYESYQMQDDINETLYRKAGNLMELGDYEEAVKVFDGIQDYEGVKEQINECNYLIAESFYKDKNYSKAIDVFQELGDYKKSFDYFKNCCKQLKFEKFDFDAFRNDFFGSDLSNEELQKEIEEILSRDFYRVWYRENTDEQLNINSETITDKPYGILSYKCIYDRTLTTVIQYYYFEQPNEIHTCSFMQDENYITVTDEMIFGMEFDNRKYFSVNSEMKNSLDSQLIYEQEQSKKEDVLMAIYSDIKSQVEFDLGNKNKLEEIANPLTFYFPSYAEVMKIEGNGIVEFKFNISYKGSWGSLLGDFDTSKSEYYMVDAYYNVDYNTCTYSKININYMQIYQ